MAELGEANIGGRMVPAWLLNLTAEELDGLKWYSNPNLIDNWYFVGGGGPGQFPINQRGVSAGTAGWSDYFIDRYLGQCTYKILLEGLEIQAGGYLVQQFEMLPPLPVTYSFLATTGLWFVTFTQYGAMSIPGIGFVELNQSSKYIAIKADKTLVLQAQKLELGSMQTLAHQEGEKWVLNETPDYAEELVKCQRYAQVIAQKNQTYFAKTYLDANGIDFNIPITATMRDGNPTVDILSNGAIRLFVSGKGDQDGFAFTAYNCQNLIRIAASKQNHGITNSDYVFLILNNVLLSREL